MRLKKEYNTQIRRIKKISQEKLLSQPESLSRLTVVYMTLAELGMC
jgi:hypothetical protein